MSETDNVNADNLNDEYIDDMLKKLETTDNPDNDAKSDEQQANEDNIVMLNLIAQTAQSVSKIISRKTGIKSIELDNNDRQELQLALHPLAPYMPDIIKYMPFIPIIVFVIGYLIRIFTEYKDIQKAKKEKKNLANSDNPVTSNKDSKPNNEIKKVSDNV